ncbi:MAG TPA: vitamin K epoxide reductase family protein [Longilinea sp.]|nr:vitamin K epoxide reductase family protein [Longilinea sp.]
MTFLRKSSLVLAILGLGVAIYLFIIKIADNPALCTTAGGGCWTVNTSSYSEIFGIPVSLFGAAGYIAIIGLLILEGRLKKIDNGIFHYGIFGLSLVGVLFSAYLTFIEIVVLKAICPFCVSSAVLMTVIFIFSIARLIKETGKS